MGRTDVNSSRKPRCASLSAAGLFVSPSPGPVLANYGLYTLRFVKPVGMGHAIQARLTCKRKTDKPARKGQPAQIVVAWDVQVTYQDDELEPSDDILTLVLKRPGRGPQAGEQAAYDGAVEGDPGCFTWTPPDAA